MSNTRLIPTLLTKDEFDDQLTKCKKSLLETQKEKTQLCSQMFYGDGVVQLNHPAECRKISNKVDAKQLECTTLEQEFKRFTN